MECAYLPGMFQTVSVILLPRRYLAREKTVRVKLSAQFIESIKPPERGPARLLGRSDTRPWPSREPGRQTYLDTILSHQRPHAPSDARTLSGDRTGGGPRFSRRGAPRGSSRERPRRREARSARRRQL